MKDLEENYWRNQKKIYDSLEYPKELKYFSWQPARWAANAAAVRRILETAGDIKSICEFGAGSAAFSFEMYRQCHSIELTALDRSKIACEYGKQIAEDLNIPINYLYEDFWNYKGNKKYDMVLSLGVIEHFDEADQIRFIEKCKESSNKYVMVAIPNQESVIFKSYIKWCNKNNNDYEEKHNVLNIEMLVDLLKKCDLEVMIVDGFQVYLSECDFLGSTINENKKYILKLKEALIKEKADFGELYPNYNFKCDDIPSMTNAELSFTQSERLEMSFMIYALCRKKI